MVAVGRQDDSSDVEAMVAPHQLYTVHSFDSLGDIVDSLIFASCAGVW